MVAMSEGCAMGATNRARIENLEDWQRRQNGKIDRIDEKVDKVANIVTTNTNRMLGGIAVACILLVVDIILRYAGGGG